MPHNNEQLSTPEQEGKLLDSIVDGMKLLAPALYSDHEATLISSWRQVAFLPELGRLRKMQIAHDLVVGVTQQRSPDQPQGVEIDCSFTYDPEANEGAGDFTLYDGQAQVEISVPIENSRDKAHYKFHKEPDGSYTVETYSDIPLLPEDLEAYSALPKAMAEALSPDMIPATNE